MKLYDFALAPNPRRARIFIAEKGLDIETEQVSIRDGAQFSDEFKAINPNCSVPVLVLDDGTALYETSAICRYLEEAYPEPPLMGRDAKERAVVELWHKRVELEGLGAVAEALRNSIPRFVDHAVPGTAKVPQIPAMVDRGKARTATFFDMLNARLSDSDYVAGDSYSIADILALVVVDFSKMIEMQPGDQHSAIWAWHEKVSARPSAKA